MISQGVKGARTVLVDYERHVDGKGEEGSGVAGREHSGSYSVFSLDVVGGEIARM